VDFKLINAKGDVVATAVGACAAMAMLRADFSAIGSHVLLDDTGVELSESDLAVLCDAERK